MKWRKLGRIFEPNNNYPWMVSHATCPFVMKTKNNDIMKFFFSCRDKNGYSHIGYIDYSFEKRKTLKINKKPLLKPGLPGLFDDAGVVLFQIINIKNIYYLYYSGWSIKMTVPFDFYIGLATSSEINSEFKRYSITPIMDRTSTEPFLIGAPWIIIENNVWRMWYISGDKWIKENNNYKHFYSIKYAESKDGINWEEKNICINYKNKYEYAFARPFVIKEQGKYKMWYSFRGQKNIDTYRIGYAESKDGINWIRKDDEVGIDVSPSGWDSEMICYPCVFDHKGNRYMLYNGNGYGKTGFGLAVLEQD